MESDRRNKKDEKPNQKLDIGALMRGGDLSAGDDDFEDPYEGITDIIASESSRGEITGYDVDEHDGPVKTLAQVVKEEVEQLESHDLAMREDRGEIDPDEGDDLTYGGLDETLSESPVTNLPSSLRSMISGHTQWHTVNLSGHDLDGTNFGGIAYEDGLRLTGAQSARECDFTYCIIPNSNFDRLDLTDSDFTEADISGSSAKNIICKNGIFDACTAAKLEFSGDFRYSSWDAADLRNATAGAGTILDESTFSDTDLRGTDLSACSAKNVLWIRCIVDANTKLPEGNDEDLVALRKQIESLLGQRKAAVSVEQQEVDPADVPKSRLDRLKELRKKK